MNRPEFLRTTLAAALLALVPASALAEGNVRLVLKGYDPVAYFTEHKAVQGDPRFSHDWDEGRYYFANARHLAMFMNEPERYAPEFGGFCTGSMSRGVRNEGDPHAWIVSDGRLYVFGAVKFKELAEKDPAYLPAKAAGAREKWPAARNR